MAAGPAHVPGAHTRAGNAMNRTRAGLLAGASRAFAEHGLKAATMQSIAVAAGVSKATLYNHFRTKDDVVRALLAAERGRVVGAVSELPLAQALTQVADELAVHPVLRRLADVEPDTLLRELAADGDRWPELTTLLAQALQLDVDDADLVARWLLGVVVQPGRSTTRRRHAERLAAMLAGDS